MHADVPTPARARAGDRTAIARRRLIAAAAALGAATLARTAPAASAAGAAPRSIVVLPFDFLDDHANRDPAVVDAQHRRLARAHRDLEAQLAERGLYRVVALPPADALVDRLRSEHEALHRCVDCAERVGRAHGAELAMATWVQKVSELILNLNVEVRDVASERPILAKSVDLRGNDDVSWSRAVRYLVRDMADRRAANPGYGR